MMSRYLFSSIVIFLTFFHVTAQNQFPDHMINFTQQEDGRLITTVPNWRWRFWNASGPDDTSIPQVYRNVANVTNPIIALQPRNNTRGPQYVYGSGDDYQNIVLLADTFKLTLPPGYEEKNGIVTWYPRVILCIAAEGFDPQMPGTAEMGFHFPAVDQNSEAHTVKHLVNSAGEIESAQVSVEVNSAVKSCVRDCNYKFFLYLSTISVNQTSNNLANPQARFYITSPKAGFLPTLNETECPTNLLSLIRAHKASLIPSSSSNSTSSTGSTTNTTSTSTGDSSAPTNSSSSNNSTSTSTSGGSSISTNSSESSSPTTTPTPTATPTPTTPPVAPPALPITTLNFKGNTILTIDNASKFKGPSNGYLVSVWFKLLSSSLPPLDTPQTVFRAFATTPASATITQLGLVLIRTRPSAYTIRLIIGNGAYEWTFTDLRHDEWEHIMAVRNDDYVYLVINNRRIESQKGVGAETFGATPTTAVIGGSGMNGQTINEAFTGLLHRIVVTTGSYELKIKMPSSTEVSAYANTIYNNGIPANITVYPGLDPKIVYVLTNDTRFMKNANGQVRFIDQLNSHDTTTEAVANSATINFVQQSPGVAVPTTASPTTSSPTTPSPTISGSSSSSNSSTGGLGGSSSPNNTTQSSSGAGSSSSSTAGATPPNASYQNTISIAAIVITGITCIGRLF